MSAGPAPGSIAGALDASVDVEPAAVRGRDQQVEAHGERAGPAAGLAVRKRQQQERAAGGVGQGGATGQGGSGVRSSCRDPRGQARTQAPGGNVVSKRSTTLWPSAVSPRRSPEPFKVIAVATGSSKALSKTSPGERVAGGCGP